MATKDDLVDAVKTIRYELVVALVDGDSVRVRVGDDLARFRSAVSQGSCPMKSESGSRGCPRHFPPPTIVNSRGSGNAEMPNLSFTTQPR